MGMAKCTCRPTSCLHKTPCPSHAGDEGLARPSSAAPSVLRSTTAAALLPAAAGGGGGSGGGCAVVGTSIPGDGAASHGISSAAQWHQPRSSGSGAGRPHSAAPAVAVSRPPTMVAPRSAEQPVPQQVLQHIMQYAGGVVVCKVI
jgi:hypothetical protein